MIDLGALQGIVNNFMQTPVVIRHRATDVKDPGNRAGDMDAEWDTTTTSVMGWFVDKGTRSFSSVGGMSAVVDEPTLRVPVGTRIGPRDEVTINGNTWTVVDASNDETWPVMVKAELTKIK